jgi:hypothetical protein
VTALLQGGLLTTPAHICIFSAFLSPPSTGTNSSLGQHSVYFLSTLQIVKFIFLVTSIKQQTLAGVGLINFTSICFITEDTEMWCLLTVVLKQVFYMASILRSLHIPALNANQRTREKIKKYPIWILQNLQYVAFKFWWLARFCFLFDSGQFFLSRP